MAIDLLQDFSAKQEKECRGLVFRGYSTMFMSNGRIEKKQGLRLLKRKSCKGCEKCAWMLDDMHEFLCVDALVLPAVEDSELYSVRIINEFRDYETGVIDDYEFEFFKL